MVQRAQVVFEGTFQHEDRDMFVGAHFRAGGDIYFGSCNSTTRWEVDKDSNNQSNEIVSYRLYQNPAPVIEPDGFMDVPMELEQMEQALHLGETAIEQCRVVLGEMGGIGKTELYLYPIA